MIVGLSGRKRSGKDSLADYLVREHNFVRVAFADPLKDVLLHLNPDITGVNRQKASLQGLHQIYGGWEGLKAADNWAPEIRRLQQDLGVGVREHVHTDTWLNAALRRVTALTADGHNVVITDMRFENEVDGVRSLGGLIIRIERDSIPAESLQDTHVSEALMDDMNILRPDLIINSDPFITFGERAYRAIQAATSADQMAEWLQRGIDAGWVTAPYCDTHDGTPYTGEESAAWEEGDDICIHSVRLIPDGLTWADFEGGRQAYGEWKPRA